MTESLNSTRRRFLAAAGAGSAAGAVGLIGGGSAAAAEASRRHAGSSREPVVAFVEHPESDTVRLLVGEREVVVHDRELAVRILNAAGRK